MTPDAPALVRAACAARGCHQNDLARALGVSPVTVSRWVHGHRKPDAPAVALLRVIAGEVTVAGLFGRQA